MTYVIAEPCTATCDQACLDVCPVDCIHGPISHEEIRAIAKDERRVRLPTIQLFIDPDDCIHCGACEPECPVAAIFADDALPPRWAHYVEKNARFFSDRRAAGKP
jgi:NAD-dependent dihydropyrimidine dehydrogenase PreA subunit